MTSAKTIAPMSTTRNLHHHSGSEREEGARKIYRAESHRFSNKQGCSVCHRKRGAITFAKLASASAGAITATMVPHTCTPEHGHVRRRVLDQYRRIPKSVLGTYLLPRGLHLPRPLEPQPLCQRPEQRLPHDRKVLRKHTKVRVAVRKLDQRGHQGVDVPQPRHGGPHRAHDQRRVHLQPGRIRQRDFVCIHTTR